MTALQDEIEAAEAHLARLKRQSAGATCAVAGHRWKFRGGANAGCHKECCCSVPVRECEVCEDSDYGDPARAEIIEACDWRGGEGQ